MSANKAIATVLFMLAVFGSLISQTPSILASHHDAVLKLLWILPFGFIFLTSPQNYLSNKLMPFYAFIFGMTLFCFACQMATGRKYFTEDLYFIAISLMITMASYGFWLHYGSRKMLTAISLIMLVCGLFLAFEFYTWFLRGRSLMESTYAYDEKNSISSVLMCCAVFTFLFYTPGKKILYWGSRFVAALLLVIMTMTKSRATILSALFILAYFAFKAKSKKLRLGIIAITLIAVAYIALNANIADILINGIILAGRDASDINSLSSNRLVLFTYAIELIPQHPFIGSGDYYVDCMPLNFLTQYGIIGLAMVLAFLFSAYRSIIKARRSTTDNRVCMATFVLFIAFLINSLLEARAPFGPGVKCFTLWMMFGFALAVWQNEVLSEPSGQQLLKEEA